MARRMREDAASRVPSRGRAFVRASRSSRSPWDGGAFAPVASAISATTTWSVERSSSSKPSARRLRISSSKSFSAMPIERCWASVNESGPIGGCSRQHPRSVSNRRVRIVGEARQRQLGLEASRSSGVHGPLLIGRHRAAADRRPARKAMHEPASAVRWDRAAGVCGSCSSLVLEPR